LTLSLPSPHSRRPPSGCNFIWYSPASGGEVNPMVIYDITVPDATRAEEFPDFMLNDIFTGIQKSVSRTGQVDKLILLRGDNTETANQFIWIVSGILNAVPDDAISKIEAFGARISNRNDSTEIARWVREDSTPTQIQ